MKLLIIDNYDSFTYNLVQMIDELSVTNYDVVPHDKVGIDEVNKYDKILITPGPGLPADHPNLKKVIEQYAKSKSILGICLGHQAIAETFGGKLFRQENVSHGITKQLIVTDANEHLFSWIPGQMTVGLYHSWAVSKNNFPDELKITAISEDEVIMALSHKQYDIKGVQFHPESIMTPLGKVILRNWVGR